MKRSVTTAPPIPSSPPPFPVDAVPDDQVLEAGWEELGISDERAAEIAGAMMDESEDLLGVDFYKVRASPCASALFVVAVQPSTFLRSGFVAL